MVPLSSTQVNDPHCLTLVVTEGAAAVVLENTIQRRIPLSSRIAGKRTRRQENSNEFALISFSCASVKVTPYAQIRLWYGWVGKTKDPSKDERVLLPAAIIKKAAYAAA